MRDFQVETHRVFVKLTCLEDLGTHSDVLCSYLLTAAEADELAQALMAAKADCLTGEVGREGEGI